MALSYAQYAGDGNNYTFSVPFQYLARTHVAVSVDGSPRSFSWLSANQVSVSPTPAKGSVVEVRRTTPRDKILVDFVDGSVLTEGDLDTAALQTFFLAQEAFDLQGGTLGLAPDGSFSAYNRRLANVGAPVNGGDAINKDYLDGTFIPQMNNILTQATQAKDQSVTAKGQSEAARDAANQSKSAAAVSEANAKTSETNAKTSETNAGNSANLANGAKDRAILAETTARDKAQVATDKAGQAQSSADTALTQAGISNQRAIDSAASATNSANSATTVATARDKAQKWAEENEDVAVETGMFSAKHWAKKALAYAGAMKLPAIVAGAYMRGKADLTSWETVTPAQLRADLNAANRGGDTFTGQVNMDSNLVVGGVIYGGNEIAAPTLRASGAYVFVDNPGYYNTHLCLRTQGGYLRGALYYTTDDHLRLELRDGNSPKAKVVLRPNGSVDIAGATVGSDGNIWSAAFGYDWLTNWVGTQVGNVNNWVETQVGNVHNWVETQVGNVNNWVETQVGNVNNGLATKVDNLENCSGAGITTGSTPYFVRQNGGGNVFMPRNLSTSDIAFTWDSHLYFNINSSSGWRMLSDTPANLSDLRVKREVQDVVGGLDVVKSLRPVTFQYDPEKSPLGMADYNLGTRYGFIAQEVQNVFPDAVKELEIPFDADGKTTKVVNGKKVTFNKEDWEDKLKIVQQEQFIAVLVKAVQELSARVDKLEGLK